METLTRLCRHYQLQSTEYRVPSIRPSEPWLGWSTSKNKETNKIQKIDLKLRKSTLDNKDLNGVQSAEL